MTRRRRFIEVFREPMGLLITLAILVFLVGAAVVVFVAYNLRPLPADRELIENFERNRARFERLLEIVRQPSQIDTVWTSFRGQPDSYEVLRLNGPDGEEARRLMNRLDVSGVYGGSSHVSIYIGNPIRGDLKGYEKGYYYHSPSDPMGLSRDQVVESLDGIKVDYGAPKYRRIDDSWYLFKQSTESD